MVLTAQFRVLPIALVVQLVDIARLLVRGRIPAQFAMQARIHPLGQAFAVRAKLGDMVIRPGWVHVPTARQEPIAQQLGQ